MMRASHSSYRSLSGGWRASISLKSAGMNLVWRRRSNDARQPLVVQVLERRLALDHLKSAGMNLVWRPRELPLIRASK